MKFTLCMIAMVFTATQASDLQKKLKEVQEMVQELDAHKQSIQESIEVGLREFRWKCDEIQRVIFKETRKMPLSGQRSTIEMLCDVAGLISVAKETMPISLNVHHSAQDAISNAIDKLY